MLRKVTPPHTTRSRRERGGEPYVLLAAVAARAHRALAARPDELRVVLPLVGVQRLRRRVRLAAAGRRADEPAHRLRRDLRGVPAERSLRQLGAHLDRRRRPAEHRARREVKGRRHRRRRLRARRDRDLALAEVADRRLVPRQLRDVRERGRRGERLAGRRRHRRRRLHRRRRRDRRRRLHRCRRRHRRRWWRRRHRRPRQRRLHIRRQRRRRLHLRRFRHRRRRRFGTAAPAPAGGSSAGGISAGNVPAVRFAGCSRVPTSSGCLLRLWRHMQFALPSCSPAPGTRRASRASCRACACAPPPTARRAPRAAGRRRRWRHGSVQNSASSRAWSSAPSAS